VFVGVKNGTRIRLLQDYIDAPAWNRPGPAAQLTLEFWRFRSTTPLSISFEGIVRLVVFAFLALVARFYLRRSKMNSLLANTELATEEAGPVVTAR
jgi:hypothetical protein